MPNYHFKCLKCGHEFEALLPAAHEGQKCLECGHDETEKLLKAPGVQFKGGGFYSTDSKKKDDKCDSCPDKTCPNNPKS